MRLTSLSLALLFLLSACGTEESREITDVQVRVKPRHVVPPDLTAEQRLGLKSRKRSKRAPLAWKTPAGWEAYDAESEMRTASWRVIGEPKTDCSLTLLPSRGGAAANVNRWRGEMGLDPLDAAQVEALPRYAVLAVEGIYLDLEGDFSGGRSTGGALPNARMLGIVLQGPAASIFVKFTGPAAVVLANKKQFEALLDSFQFNQAGTGAPAGSAPAGRLQWTAPKDWTPQAKRPMRDATFIPTDMPDGWCYIGQIGGGVGPNLNRWRGEMGHEGLSAEGIAKLPKVAFEGGEGVFQELNGTFRGTGGSGQPLEDATMYAFMAERGGMFVFIKMVGPAAKMGAQKDRFLALCKSLR